MSETSRKDVANPSDGPPKKKKRILSDKQKAALKELRVLKSEEQAVILKEFMSATRKGKKAVKKALEAGPATVPELATTTELPGDKVLWLIAGLRKYGEIEQTETDGDYPRYALTLKP